MKGPVVAGLWILLAALSPVALLGAQAGGQSPLAEPDAGEIFINANQAYEAGSYGLAVELYRSLLERGHRSGYLYYNLGNAYLRNGELGRAIAAYRRGRSLMPRDEDVQANLSFARRSAKDAIEPPEPSAVASTLFFWHYGLSEAELAVAALALNLLFWGVLALGHLRRGSEVPRWIALALLLPLLAVGGSLVARRAVPERIAVVLPQQIPAHAGPAEHEIVRFKVHAGSELRVRARRDGWLRIALPDGQQGWIEHRFAEVIGERDPAMRLDL